MKRSDDALDDAAINLNAVTYLWDSQCSMEIKTSWLISCTWQRTSHWIAICKFSTRLTSNSLLDYSTTERNCREARLLLRFFSFLLTLVDHPFSSNNRGKIISWSWFFECSYTLSSVAQFFMTDHQKMNRNDAKWLKASRLIEMIIWMMMWNFVSSSLLIVDYDDIKIWFESNEV